MKNENIFIDKKCNNCKTRLTKIDVKIERCLYCLKSLKKTNLSP